ncbi:hypothetical protein JTE90_011745 [Oedothorax gibbosus]|uniref:DUF2382 domain-containing protein n=1 Tax=Oedothorax gibbosus TaxID=931172 RepID=A0AAV6U1Y5_9ARAC|nr:hypothetical protein JTE90_011745 [Oedothorax gibbosus]
MWAVRWDQDNVARILVQAKAKVYPCIQKKCAWLLASGWKDCTWEVIKPRKETVVPLEEKVVRLTGKRVSLEEADVPLEKKVLRLTEKEVSLEEKSVPLEEK